MDLFGGKGLDIDVDTAFTGGEGGKSTIKFTLEQNVEYIITGLYEEVNAPFLYRKASLIAVAGGGGRPTTLGNGLDGGGVSIRGDRGRNLPSFIGGLNDQAFFTSLSEYPVDQIIEPDLYITPQNPISGGRTHACTRGDYWRDQGLSSCEDIPSGNKFRLADGTEVLNTSASITRGFKTGYINIRTGGPGSTEFRGLEAGNGGSGASGGTGAGTNADGTSNGGGGGSGYSDGSVTIVSTQQGGSEGPAKVVIRLAS